MPGFLPRCERIGWKDAIGGAKKRRKTHVDKIDARQTEHHVTVRHDTLLEEPIQQIENGGIGTRQHPGRPGLPDFGDWTSRHLNQSLTNVYGGHGPVSAT